MINNLSLKKMKEVFKKGVVISIKSTKTNSVIVSVLQKVERNEIYFRVSSEFLAGNILEGDVLELNAFIEEYEYILTGQILKIDLNYPNFVEVTIHEIKKFKNRRKHKRYIVNFQANVYVPIEKDAVSYSVINNISREGICIVSKKHLEVYTKVRIKAGVNYNDIKIIEFTAAVIKRADYGEDCNEYGMEIIQIEEKDRELLDKLIYQLEKNESLLIKENLK